jgi:enoyl-CoA hydratase/carnithine racemase
MPELVRWEVADGVGLITLDRPERLNALDDAMHVALDAAARQAFTDDAARVVVIAGAGRAFCAGADMSRLDRLIAQGSVDYDIPRPGAASPAYRDLAGDPAALNTYSFPRALAKPVIAAVNGPCIGVAMVIACACDVRFVAPDAMFAAAFGQRGVVAEFGLAWLLPRLVGANAAADLLLSGRRLGAAEAIALGLARASEGDVLATAMDYAREIAATSSPRSTALIKQQLIAASGQSYAEASAEAYDLLMESFSTSDFAEGVASFREKRRPRFTGR